MRNFVLTVLMSISTMWATAQALKIDPRLTERFAVSTHVEYIVLMKDRAVFNRLPSSWTKIQRGSFVYNNLLAKASKTQAEIIGLLRQRAIPHRSFYVTNAISVTSDRKTMEELAARSDVETVMDNTPLRMLDYTVDRSQPASRGGEPEWGLKMIKADSVWEMGYTGQGVVIGGQDTGYDWDLSPLKTKYRGYIDSTTADHNYNWHDAIHKNNPVYPDSLINSCGYSLPVPCDDNTHGTHTMGTMVGSDQDNSIGVAPDARWIGCRNMDRGWGQPTTYIECFEWLLAPYDLNGMNADPGMAPHVINNSWYCSTDEGCNPANFILMEEVVNNLKAAGIVVVVSAGNSGWEGCGSVTGPPAFFEGSFSVGATDSNDNIAGFSSRGPVVIDSSLRLKPNVSAPGVGVRSVVKGGGFAFFNGTSMAGPHVAGLVGLILSANPALAGKVELIEDIIEQTAVPRTDTTMCGNVPGTSIPNPFYGYGRVNAVTAVTRALEIASQTQDTDDSGLYVYPNPVSDLVTITAPDKEEISKVEIFSAAGTLAKRQDGSGLRSLFIMDLSGLPAGLYYYRVQFKNRSQAGKLVKH